MSTQDKRWFKVPLTPDQKKALTIAAGANLRNIRQQAQVYIAEGLSRDGLLDNVVTISCPHCQCSLPISESMLVDALGVDPVETDE